MNQELQHKKKRIVQFLLEQKVLLEPEFLDILNAANDTRQVFDLINKRLEQQTDPRPLPSQSGRDGKVRVVFSYKEQPKKIVVQDFINHFNSRYSILKRILQQRNNLENAVSIGRLKGKPEREQVSIIGMVYTKEETKSGVMLTAEDPTGSIKVFFSKNKADLLARANDIVDDEVIGISGSMGKNIIFANELYFPDIPVTKEIKKSPVEEYVLFISDIHVGSKQFLEEEFVKFVNWLRGEVGNERQRDIASKVKYVVVTGDLVDGISVYPSQKEELDILTYRGQYTKFIEYIKQIPQDIKIIVCPGNHDVVHLAEPQPPLPREYCEGLWDMPNVTMVSNPALVNIASRDGFAGFDILMYHGYSYNHYADKVESIRIQKPNISERADLVMRLLLQKRHLAPTYDGNPHLPTEQDHLVIDKIPDIFVSGDVHKSAVFTYKGVITGIIGSCFQSRTSFQEKVGHVPDPGRIPIINLKTREVKVLNFSGQTEQ